VSVFFWSIFTHPILDCFTNWGTQIWQPFSDLRVQWNTVSVVDPVATIPFGICLIILSFYSREKRPRFWWNIAGLAWFCGYLCLYTVWHKVEVNRLFKEKLAAQHIDYQRTYTNPTIFNNIVWYGVAEGDTAYYCGLYGFNDERREFGRLSTIPKDHHLLNHIPQEDRAYRFLRWFSDGYYNVMPYRGDTLQVNDLRFGLLGDTLRGNNYVFPFLLFKNKDGAWDILQNNRNQENIEASERSFGELWGRVKGVPPSQ
jgi:inner membrane protein